MVSAEIDAHFLDDLAMMRLTASGYSMIVKFIKEMARTFARNASFSASKEATTWKRSAESVNATFDIGATVKSRKPGQSE